MRYSIISILVIASSCLSASPSIDRIDPQGDTWVIEGSDFGSGPQVILFDDLSGADITREGQSLSDHPDILKPQAGEWRELRDNAVFTEDMFGNPSGALLVRDTQSGNNVRLVSGEPDSEGVHGLSHFQQIYYSFSLKDLGNFPHGTSESFASISSTKDSWMMFGDRGDNTSYSVNTLDEPSGHDLYIPAWAGGGFVIAGNNTSMSPSYWNGHLKDDWDFGGWVSYMFHAKLDPQDPYGKADGFFAFLNKNRFDKNHRDGNMMSDQTEEGVPYPYWDRVKFNAWVRSNGDDIRRAMSKFYVAIGDNAQARVLLTDGPSMTESTRILHLHPRQWSDGSIQVDEPLIGDSGEYFIHVVNSDGVYSDGVQMCVECAPKAIRNLTVD